MSETDSITSEESEKKIIPEIKEKDKFKGYQCQHCNYKTNRLTRFIGHVTRKIPCYVEKNYDFGVFKANELYKKKSEYILDMLDKLENKEEVDMNKLNKYISQIEKLGRVYPNFKPEDIIEIRKIIEEFKNKEI